MNDYGLEMLRHNNWATLGLIDFIASLPEEALDATAPGTYGRIRETLVHLVAAQERYTKTLSGKSPTEAIVNERQGWPGLTTLQEVATDSGRIVEELAEKGQSGWSFRYQSVSGERWSTQASVLFAQTVHHATDHRSQIATMLSQAGIQPPDLDVWVWAGATGREARES
ncbi:MAG TPA: DinB family protein [Dehalococcoidia bacterium]